MQAGGHTEALLPEGSCVCYSSVKIFNQLPQNLFKFCNNIHTFKTVKRLLC